MSATNALPAPSSSTADEACQQALNTVAERLSSSLGAAHEALSPEQRAVEVIQRTAAALPPEKIAVTFNGGKDAVVMLELIIRTLGLDWLKKCFIFVLIDTDGEFPQLIEFRKQYFATRLPGMTLHEIESRDGMRQGLWRALHQFPFSAAFMGTRKDDPGGKYQQVPWKLTTAGWPPMIRVCPILSWTFTNVWEFIQSNQIPFCDLYRNGYTSLGDVKVTSPNALLRQKDGSYLPAWALIVENGERAGRADEASAI